MVASAALLVSVALVLSSLVFPSWGLVIVNLGAETVFEDYNVTSLTQVGNQIVGAPFDSSFPPSQNWGLRPVGNNFFSVARCRADGAETFAIAAQVDGLSGRELNAQEIGFGTPFLVEQPFGSGTEIFSFTLANVPTKLAITAGPNTNTPLTLERYDPLNKYQHWVWAGPPPSGTTAGPIDVKSLPTASLSDALAASPKTN
ncbi:hypothetical protein AURDEDRAFT_154564 [Auricularia subglabra TFB-10046 SS5]|nr:hypothetical protein AURDEDRAFT_154564 [Auricularia subglabra TFB-10046 SS5]